MIYYNGTMRKRQFIEELIDQVPHEKRPLFKKLAAMEKYQHSASFRFLFHGHLFFLSMPLVAGIYWLFPRLKQFISSFFWNEFWAFGVSSFLLACFLGLLTRHMPFKLNQQGLHFVHGVFIVGVLISSVLLGQFILKP